MKKHVLGMALSLFLVGCGGGSDSNDANNTVNNSGASDKAPSTSPVQDLSALEILFGNNKSNIIELTGYNASTAHIENSAKKVGYINGTFLKFLASGSGMSLQELTQKISSAALSGDSITLGSKGEISVSISTANGGVGYIITSNSLDMTFPQVSILESSSGKIPFGYSSSNQSLKFEFTLDMSTQRYLYSRFEQGDVVYGFSENSQGDHEFLVKDRVNSISNEYLITYFSNSQLVKVVKNGSEVSTGTYNASTDTISGF
ncbi:hypothetical protein VIBNISFn27_170134 [Vibrio nigripulchritudo SFn27]|uniref:Lipoprotein n=1 Tax=Vibrio nigripulchritudo TaxID=28173 RepID=U4K8G0_9VIBR|nr:hypothetical protein [Vibrio nigripulchritudo]CCN84721.1 hypothetical protein VIBNIBLFn1_870040 [Vibrio nigripulchritudo BLFn1]CCN87787.1 hypothetical protein VIBNISFn27_170134 [Vibrio nigripulchritudo SFn27]CCN95718.1 hypothetical protein VIBNIENn2_630040 [Vibrio nigripulchritudo ENn2]CCO38873.1 hypothetical protein VIBNISFn135_1090041 [Vibrio nigripulchritudo SFn135]CCO51833.1 hypothetical protein VIBNIWn13_150041 [Vibrio nigripulchritudo Wn13]